MFLGMPPTIVLHKIRQDECIKTLREVCIYRGWMDTYMYTKEKIDETLLSCSCFRGWGWGLGESTQSKMFMIYQNHTR